STLEVDRGGVSYTVDTLSEIAASYDHAELFFLMGADSLRELPTWRQPEQILALATPVVVRRGSEPEPDFSPLAAFCSAERLQEIKNAQVPMPLIDISSTTIRRDCSLGHTIRYRVPRAVEQYISTHELYRSP
ncbi:MAG: nicotinic acid mononucleotide adenylyltransferase, partial [Planctomycetales bacterium]|nr:nicotinic acid mononucleotide adenylyltransferase [Planctomycetales bacterium]